MEPVDPPGEYLDDDALGDLEQIASEDDPAARERDLLTFLEREFSACMAIVRGARRSMFMQGVYRAIAEERFPVAYHVSALLMDERA